MEVFANCAHTAEDIYYYLQVGAALYNRIDIDDFLADFIRGENKIGNITVVKYTKETDCVFNGFYYLHSGDQSYYYVRASRPYPTISSLLLAPTLIERFSSLFREIITIQNDANEETIRTLVSNLGIVCNDITEIMIDELTDDPCEYGVLSLFVDHKYTINRDVFEISREISRFIKQKTGLSPFFGIFLISGTTVITVPHLVGIDGPVGKSYINVLFGFYFGAYGSRYKESVFHSCEAKVESRFISVSAVTYPDAVVLFFG